jgi:hypothetical protein
MNDATDFFIPIRRSGFFQFLQGDEIGNRRNQRYQKRISENEVQHFARHCLSEAQKVAVALCDFQTKSKLTELLA